MTFNNYSTADGDWRECTVCGEEYLRTQWYTDREFCPGCKDGQKDAYEDQKFQEKRDGEL